MPPESFSVLFRNNHFSVLYKSGTQHELFTLVTDVGYRTNSSVVWETLSTLEGDSFFYDGSMKKYEGGSQSFFGGFLNDSPDDNVLDSDRE